MSATETPKLEVQIREKLGSRYSDRVRKEGFIPAVIYGHKKGPVHVQANKGALVELLRSHAHLIDVVVSGKTEHCVVKDMQWDYLGDNIIHVDLERVDLSEKVTLEVDLVLAGDPKALNEAGAFLDHPISKLEVACRADSIPENVTVDISELTTEKAITVADINMPAGVEATTDADSVVAQIKIAKEQPEEEVVEAGEGEPEVIGAKEEEEKSE
ncbi:50S ribosomal protein L25 [Poriferisphaera sp. WC338]|uniref:50S ribosomal protein L25 n=1 Tax=Poriferisphaera sp. WC338 TaxID=3425129 RepID=UPI003D814AB8